MPLIGIFPLFSIDSEQMQPLQQFGREIVQSPRFGPVHPQRILFLELKGFISPSNDLTGSVFNYVKGLMGVDLC